MGELITFACEIQNKGVLTMNFNIFDKNEIEKYKEEVKKKWGNTEAYKEYKQKNIAQNEDSYGKMANKLMGLFCELGKLKHLPPHSTEVQNKISELQKLITDNCYECTNEILIGLSEMYVWDERFKNNIDKAGGDGTADFVKQAVAAHCSRE